MVIWLQSRPPKQVSLDKNDFAAEGGEGQVYLWNDLAIKLYKDPARALVKGKLEELAVFDHDQILRPLYLAVDEKGQPLGYAMKRLNNAVSLCKLFTNEFRNRNGIGPRDTGELIKNIEQVLKHIHAAGCLMVDVNDMNILVDEASLKKPMFIDVDSYQTRSYPAAAMMAAFRDYHSPTLSELSDWFSFSILAFQLFVGIHPFKGTHPDYKRGDLEGRMRAQVSVLNKEVTLPRAARDLSLIPREYRGWFEALYVNGQRLEPPGVAGPIVLAQPKAAAAGTALGLSLESQQQSDILEMLGDHLITAEGVFDLQGRRLLAGSPQAAYLLSPVSGEIVRAEIEHRRLCLATRRGALPLTLAGQRVMATGNQLYVRHAWHLTAVTLQEFSGKIIPAAGACWAVMPYATEVYDGLCFQNALGSAWAVIPGMGGGPSCHVIHIREFDGLRIHEARQRHGVVMVLTGTSGSYDLHILRIDARTGSYRLETEPDVDYHLPSFTVLDNGIVAHLRYDGRLALFDRHRGAGSPVLFDDPRLSGAMRIASSGNRTYLIEENRLYRLKTVTGS